MPLWENQKSSNYQLNILVSIVARTLERAFGDCGVFGITSYAPFSGLSEIVPRFSGRTLP